MRRKISILIARNARAVQCTPHVRRASRNRTDSFRGGNDIKKRMATLALTRIWFEVFCLHNSSESCTLSHPACPLSLPALRSCPTRRTSRPGPSNAMTSSVERTSAETESREQQQATAPRGHGWIPSSSLIRPRAEISVEKGVL